MQIVDLGGIIMVVAIGVILYIICYALLKSCGISSSEYDPSYKWADTGMIKTPVFEEKMPEPNPPTHSPIVKSQFGLDLETRWLPSVKDTMRFDREGEVLLSEIKKELRHLGFHIPEEEESLSITHFYRRIRAGGRFIESNMKVIITIDLEEMSETLGSVGSIQVHSKDKNVGEVILENVKQLMWQ